MRLRVRPLAFQANLAVVVRLRRAGYADWWLIHRKTYSSHVYAKNLSELHQKLGGWLCFNIQEVSATLFRLFAPAAIWQDASLSERQMVTPVAAQHMSSFFQG